MKIKYRLTGISTPAGGAQWQVVPTDKDIATKLIDKLEDHRVLWADATLEDPHLCLESAGRARAYLGYLIEYPGVGKKLKTNLKSIRKHFQLFETDLVDQGLTASTHCDSESLQAVLEWLRTPVGALLGHIAAQYRIQVDPDLATIIPDKHAWFFAQFDDAS